MPYNKRLFYSYLAEFTEKYTHDSPRMNAWLAAEERVSSSFSSRASEYQSFFSSSTWHGQERIGHQLLAQEIRDHHQSRVAAMDVCFSDSVSTSRAPRLTASFKLRTLRAIPRLKPVWDRSHQAGRSAAFSSAKASRRSRCSAPTNGANVRSEDEITINKSGNAAPVAILKAQPASWNVINRQRTEDSMPASRMTPRAKRWGSTGRRLNLDEIELRPLRPSARRGGFHAARPVRFHCQGDRRGWARSRGWSARPPCIRHDRLQRFRRVEDSRSTGPPPTSRRAAISRRIAWYSLDDVPGWLELQVLDTSAKPLAKAIRSVSLYQS